MPTHAVEFVGQLADRGVSGEAGETVDQDEALDAFGIILREALGDPGSHRVAADVRALEAERIHEGCKVAGKGA